MSDNIIAFKSSDFIKCEKMVQAFNDYKVNGFRYKAMVRVLFFPETESYYPVSWFGDINDPKERLEYDFKNLDFENTYNANDYVIVVDDSDMAFEYEEESFKDLISLFDKISDDYHDCVKVTILDSDDTESVEKSLEEMRQNIFKQVFGSEASLPSDLGKGN